MSTARTPPNPHHRRLSDGMRPIESLEASVRSPSIQNQEQEVQRLQKTNFNMKLRIFYLEERLAQRAGGDGNQAALEEELFQQKLLIEERSKELEDRNLLLIKSRNAIESLQADLELVRAQCHELQDTSIDISQLENKTRLLELQESKISTLELETSKHMENEKNTVRENGALRSDIQRSNEQLSLKESEIRALRLELEDQARQVSRLTTELEVARPQLSMQEHMTSAMEGKEDELDALGIQLDEMKTRNVSMESELRLVKEREKNNALKASEIARLEADEIARLHSELEGARKEKQTAIETAEQASTNLRNKLDLLTDTTSALRNLQKKQGASEAEVKVMRESRRVRDEELNAEAETRMTELRREHHTQLNTVRQQLIEQGNRLTQSDFGREEATRRLTSESDELQRSRRLCSEMQKRVLEADEARRSDEQSRTLLLDKQIRARESLEHELRTARSEIETLRVEEARSTKTLNSEATERERRITKQSREFIELIDTQLTECLSASLPSSSLSSSSSYLSSTVQQFSSEDEIPAHVSLRRAMARLDTGDIAMMNTSSNSNNIHTTSMFPQRSVLSKLYKLQKMRTSFEHVVSSAEIKYSTRVSAMEKNLEEKTKQIDRIVSKQRNAIALTGNNNAMKQTIHTLENEKNHLQHNLNESQTKLHALERLSQTSEKNLTLELTTQRKMNEDLANQLSKAAGMVESLRDAQKQLAEKMHTREQQMTIYTNELKQKSEAHRLHQEHQQHQQEHQEQQEQTNHSDEQNETILPNGSLRASIQHQVRATQQTIERSVGNLEQERSRYLSASDLNVPSSQTVGLNSSRARKVRIHRSGSVDINFNPEQMAAMVQADRQAQTQASPRTARTARTARTPRTININNQLHGKQEGLELLLREIRGLVGTTEKFLDRFFKFKGTLRAPLGARNGISISGSESFAHRPDSPTVSVLQRDVMTLLDSNARLALQLQALGKDLQTVYRRFKAMEQDNQNRPIQMNQSHNTMNDVGPIVEQMKKWGADLQNAASQLSTSQIRA